MLKNPTVIQWLHGDLSFLPTQTKEAEDAWGRAVLKERRPDLKLDKQWTNRFGEHLCEELFPGVTKPVKKNHFQPDLETPGYIIEVKTQTFFTSGTAGEKILGTPFKYADVPALYGKPLKIVCVGGAEKVCRESYGNLPGTAACTPGRSAFLEFFRARGIEYTGFLTLLEGV